MTDTTGADAAPNDGEGPTQFRVRAQYLKDLSFENPNAPHSLGLTDTPQIEVSVDVSAQPLGDDDFEVELRIVAHADRGEQKVFVVETLYAGIFTLASAPEEMLEAMCLIECPRFLYPFARQIVADATSNGGFPPLLLDPIDFIQLYQASREDGGEKAGDSGEQVH